jgi:hypothetical protein
MSSLVVGRPGRRVCELSYFAATSLRYQRRIVSGVTMPATAARRRRPRTWPVHGETASLVVGQAQSSGTVHHAEDAVLFEQVVNDRLLMSIDPAREQREEEGKRGRQLVHGGSLPERRALFNGCEIGHRAPADWAEIPDANASSDRVDRPVSRRHALGRVFAQHGPVDSGGRLAVVMQPRRMDTSRRPPIGWPQRGPGGQRLRHGSTSG